MGKTKNSVVGITGAAGFVGSHLCEKLASLGYQVRGVDNLSIGSLKNFDSIKTNKNLTFYKTDITNFQSVAKIFNKVDVIIHLAANKIPRYGNRLQTLLINTKGTENILEVVKNNKSKVIFSSTSDIYGKSNHLPFRENGDIVLGPSDVARWAYAASKIFDEHLCFGYWEQYKVPFVILRLFNIYGPRHSRNWLGGPPSLFIDSIFNEQEVEIHGSGQQTRAFTYVDDIVDAIIKSVEQQKAVGQIINLGSTQEISILNFAKLISKLAKKPLKIKRVSYRSFTGKPYEDVLRRRPDVKKAKSILNWQSTTPLEEGLKKTIAWHKRNPI